MRCARWDQTPQPIRVDLEQLRERDQTARSLARSIALSARRGASLDELYSSGKLREMVNKLDENESADTDGAECAQDHQDDSLKTNRDELEPVANGKERSSESVLSVLPMEVPVINKVSAGYPADFSDMEYPARIADEYIRTPDLLDADAFAARVVGDSMEPSYYEGDIVVFSPAREIVDGMDCFVRFEPDHDSTFKRVYFQTDDEGNELIRIQPINNSYPPRTVPREQVGGLYAGVSVTRSIGNK